MTHQECTELMKFNLGLINQTYHNSKIKGFAIVDKSCSDIKEEILMLLDNPEVPSHSVQNRDFDLYVVLEGEKRMDYIKFEGFDVGELFSFNN